MKKWFKYFVYVSIIFLIIGLIRADYLIVPNIENFTFLIISLICVFVGFFFDSFAWYKTLRAGGYSMVKVSDCVAGMGLSIFGKYIPGKIWLIVGRSAYVSKRYDLSEKDTTVFSITAQFVSLWVGLLLGSVGMFFAGAQKFIPELTLALWLLLTLLLFSRIFHNLFTVIIKKVFKRNFVLPSLSFKKVVKIMPWFFINWLFWCLGFYFLSQSMSVETFSVFIGFIFALAGIMGILAVIVPGGIGVREGVLAGMLILAGVEGALAVSIAVASRLWFLMGELFLFILGFIVDLKNKRKDAKGRC